jgi:hypothetical protein
MKYKFLAVISLLLAANYVHSAQYWIYAPSFAQSLPYVRYNSSQPIQYNSPSFNSYGNGDLVSVPNWSVSDFTGLNIPNNLKSNSEKSYSSDWYGSTAVQAYDVYIGMQLHTYSSAGDPRTLKTINYGIDFSNEWKIKPWGTFGSNAKYCVANFAAIPNSYTAEGAIGYLISRVFLRDEITNKTISLGAIIWDSRAVEPSEWIFDDADWSGATNSTVATSIYKEGVDYVTLRDYSNVTQLQVNWSDDRWYSYCITAQNIYNVKSKLASEGKYIDIDPSRLVVVSTGFEFEMATGINGVIKNGWMAARLREFNIFVEY